MLRGRGFGKNLTWRWGLRGGDLAKQIRDDTNTPAWRRPGVFLAQGASIFDGGGIFDQNLTHYHGYFDRKCILKYIEGVLKLRKLYYGDLKSQFPWSRINATPCRKSAPPVVKN